MLEILTGIGGGIISGIIAAALGFAHTHEGTNFDFASFGQTVIVGGFVGGFAGYSGVSYAEAQDYLLTTGGLTLFEYIKKAFLRRIVPVVQKWWNETVIPWWEDVS